MAHRLLRSIMSLVYSRPQPVPSVWVLDALLRSHVTSAQRWAWKEHAGCKGPLLCPAEGSAQRGWRRRGPGRNSVHLLRHLISPAPGLHPPPLSTQSSPILDQVKVVSAQSSPSVSFIISSTRSRKGDREDSSCQVVLSRSWFDVGN